MRLLSLLTKCRLVCLALLALSPTVFAQSAPATYEAGKHYEILAQPVHTHDSSKIEVVELFWFGCPHCYHFEPLIKAWKEQQAADVDFWQSPAIWNKTMQIHAQAFYTALALGVEEQLHAPIFTTLVVERKRLDDRDAIEELFANYHVDREKFKQAFNSFGVNSQVKQADARARSYHITGTPEMVVNGKYRVSAGMAGGQAEMLNVVDFLVAKERAAMASAK